MTTTPEPVTPRPDQLYRLSAVMVTTLQSIYEPGAQLREGDARRDTIAALESRDMIERVPAEDCWVITGYGRATVDIYDADEDGLPRPRRGGRPTIYGPILSGRVREDTANALMEMQKRRDIPMAQLIREALEWYVTMTGARGSGNGAS